MVGHLSNRRAKLLGLRQQLLDFYDIDAVELQGNHLWFVEGLQLLYDEVDCLRGEAAHLLEVLVPAGQLQLLSTGEHHPRR